MAIIHLIDGEKGGVGKSFVARTMIQYCLDRNLPFTAVETDRSNPDVSRVYKDICQYAVLSEDEKQADKADRIFEMAIDKPVIVSLPSQVHRSMKAWIDRNHLFQIGKECDVSFCKWFVCNGEYDVVKLFLTSLDCYQDQMTHVFVRNFGLCDDWSAIDARDEMRRLKQEIQDMYARVLDAQQHNQNFVEALSDSAGETIASLLYAKTEIDSSHERIHKLTVNSIWARLTDWLSPAVVLAFWGAIFMMFGMHLSEYLYPRSVKLSGRELMEWNLDRLIKCQKDLNPKCTFWIVPPELRK